MPISNRQLKKIEWKIEQKAKRAAERVNLRNQCDYCDPVPFETLVKRPYERKMLLEYLGTK
jgi:hypothetical protein